VSTSNYWSDWRSSGMSSDTLTYALGGDHVVSSVDVTPTERAPLTVTVQYKDANGAWVDTSAGAKSGLAVDTTKSIAFAPVTTSAIRLVLSLNFYTKISEVAVNEVVGKPADVASLAALRVANTPVAGFAADKTAYSVSAPSAATPVVAIPTDEDATVTTTRSGRQVVVKVVAADGVTTQTYTVQLNPGS
jgi:hypothetical protein